MDPSLQREIMRFDLDLDVASAHTAPASWYRDPAFVRLERVTTFHHHWHQVARLAEVSVPGQFVTVTLGAEPLVLVRGGDDQLRAFYNVCQHHGACVAQGAGVTQRLVCPYHGWSYDLEGRLVKAPRVGAIRDFDRDQHGLRQVHVQSWGPWVFVCLGTPRWSLEDGMREVGQRLSTLGMEKLRWVGQRVYEVPCNWKVFVDNYLDGGYHVPTLHPGLARELDTSSYTIESFDVTSVQSSAPAASQERMGAGAVYAFVYPNFMINRYGPIMDTNLVIPDGPSRCRVVFDDWFEDTEGPEAEAFIARSLRASDAIQEEDAAICASVQRGMESSGFTQGRYAPALEHAMFHFHRLLAQDYRSHLPNDEAPLRKFDDE